MMTILAAAMHSMVCLSDVLIFPVCYNSIIAVFIPCRKPLSLSSPIQAMSALTETSFIKLWQSIVLQGML